MEPCLDERGLPNQVGATGRRGVVTIQHETGEVIRNLEYFMLRAFGQMWNRFRRGAFSTTRLTVVRRLGLGGFRGA